MKNTQYNPNKKAFVLSLVLWISAAMMLLSLLFVRMTKDETDVYKKLHQKLLIELKSQSLFEKLSFYAATGIYNQNSIIGNLEGFPEQLMLNAQDYNITIEETTCHYSLLDQSALFNLRSLQTLKEAQNFIRQNSNIKLPFKDIYYDWIDSNDLTRLNGAEKSDYLLNGYTYGPANFNSFQHPDSLFLLKDFFLIDKNSTSKIRKHFTTYGYRPINIQLIDKLILKSFFPEIEESELQELFKLRNTNPTNYIQKFSSTLPYQAYDSYPSKIISFNIKCSKKNVESNLNAIVDFRILKKRSWSILEMNKY